MALSPLDIHNKEFSRSMFRGYDEDEVNEFLEQVLKDYENVLEEKKTLENSLKQSTEQVSHFTDFSATAGDHLRELSREFELVWCTGWEEKANAYLPPALGLPGTLPFVPFDELNRPPSARWKLVGIEAYAGTSRALAWIDDAHDERCEAWAAARRAPTLLVSTDPAIGLTDAHVGELVAWAQATLSIHG